MNYYSIPADYKTNTIDKLIDLNSKYSTSRVFELYGEMENDTSLFTSGRINGVKVNKESFCKYIKYVNKNDLKFNYVLNGANMNNNEFTEKGVYDIKELVKFLYDIGVRTFTVSLIPIIDIIKSLNLDIEIVVSTISQVNNTQDALFYDNNLNVDRIVLSENLNRNFDGIKSIQDNIKCETELIVNSACFIYCPYRMMHYNQIANGYTRKDNTISNLYYANKCSFRRTENIENYLKLAFIRPEDIIYYENIGVHYYKIQGRQSVFQGDIYKTVKQYMQRKYNGNLMELLYCFEKVPGECYINNSDLDGFILKFVKTKNNCAFGCGDCDYCKTYINKCLKSNIQLCEYMHKIHEKEDVFKR